MIGYFLNEGPVTNFEEANKSNLELFSQMYREWLKKVYSYHLLNLRNILIYKDIVKKTLKTIQAFDTAFKSYCIML